MSLETLLKGFRGFVGSKAGKAIGVLGLVGMTLGQNYNLLVNAMIDGTTSNVKDVTGKLELVTPDGFMAPQTVEDDNNGNFIYMGFTGIESPETNVTTTVISTRWNGDMGVADIGAYKVEKWTRDGKFVRSIQTNPNSNHTSFPLDDGRDAEGIYFHRIFCNDGIMREVKVTPTNGRTRGFTPGNNWEKKVVVPTKTSDESYSKNKSDSLEFKITFTPHYTSNLSGEQVYHFKLPREDGSFMKETTLKGYENKKNLKGVYRNVKDLSPVSDAKIRLEAYDGVNLTAFDSLTTDADGNYSFDVDLDSLVGKDLFITSEHSDFENSYQIVGDVNFNKQIDKIQKSSYLDRSCYGDSSFIWKFKNVDIDSLNTVLDVPVDSLSLDYVMLPTLADNVYGHPDGSTFDEAAIVQEQHDRGYTDVNAFDVRQAFATQGGYLKKPLHTGVKTKFFFDDAQFTADEIAYGKEKLTEVTAKLLGKPVADYSELYEVVTTNPGDDKCVVVNKGSPLSQYSIGNDLERLRLDNPHFNLLDKGNIFVYLNSASDKSIMKEYHRQFCGATNARSSVMNGTAAEVSLADMAESQVNNDFDKAYWNDNGHKSKRYGNPLDE